MLLCSIHYKHSPHSNFLALGIVNLDLFDRLTVCVSVVQFHGHFESLLSPYNLSLQ